MGGTDHDAERGRQAVDATGGGVDRLISFVPRLATELGERGTPTWTRLDGSMLSADISGFTALSEKLAGKGKAGAEEITALINTCFTALIDAAYGYGGEVIKFGGDALLILFRGDAHERRATDAGVAMQHALHASSAAKRANLTMTVGVADGPFEVFLVGTGYRELLITGPRASEVIRLEAAAPKGGTLVSTSIAEKLPEQVRGEQESGGVLVAATSGDAPAGPGERIPTGSDLDPYVPRQVIEQLTVFSHLGGEHRLVTVGFVMLTGLDTELERSGPESVAEALGHVVDHVVATCARFGVTVLHTDIAPDGVKFVLCAGAPINPGDTSDAMLLATLEIAEVDSPFVIKQGVQTGRVFAGFLGSEHRRTYTLMGDPVNTAARMLGKADDRDVVAVATVVDDTRTIFASDELEPFLVKGKTEPIVAHKVRSATSRIRRDSTSTRLVGRRDELEALTRAIGHLGQAVELVGAAGVGKSRLLDAAWDPAEGLVVYQAACTPYGAGVPYSVFRPLLRRGTRIADQATPEEAGVRLLDIVSRLAPQLLPMLPLLALPFGASVASTPEADAIDPEFRRMRIHELLVQFLDAVLTGPILFVVEDAHWIDDASGELVNHLIRASRDRTWVVIVTRRPEGDWRIADADHVTSLHLDPLDEAAIRELAVETCPRPLLDRDLELISARANGNPLFAIELARAMVDAGAELPDTVEQIIASRLDQLAPAVRRVVHVASVLGNQFDEDVVVSMAEADDAGFEASSALVGASSAGTVMRRSGTTWTFTHALYRDTAYEGLPFNRRRHLHRLAATIIEGRAVDPDAVAALLSLHYSQAGAHEQAWRFSLAAAASAERQHATTEAATAYERALRAGRYCSSVDRLERARVAERLGDLYYDLARSDEAAHVYALARRINDDPVVEVRLVRKIGSVCERQGRPDRAIRWYNRAAKAIPSRGLDPQWLSARADVLLAEAGIRARRDENEQCLRLAQAARRDAERAGNGALEALAYERMQLALAYLPEADVDGVGEQALAAYRELDDSAGMARTLINLGIEAYFSSDWSRASALYLEAMEIAERSGSVVLSANAAINSAEVLSDQGDWRRAAELLGSALRNYRAVGYSPGIAAATLFAGVAEMRAGDVAAAGERFETARSMLEQLGMGEMIDDLDSRELELALQAGTATLAQCDELADRFGADHPMTVRVLRVKAVVLHLAGDQSQAELVMRSALARPASEGFERALDLQALLTITPDAPDAPALTHERDAILSDLGVHTLPPVVPATVATSN